MIARFLAWLQARRATRIELLAKAAVDAFGGADYDRAQRLIRKVRRLQAAQGCTRNCSQGRACSCSAFQPTNP